MSTRKKLLDNYKVKFLLIVQIVLSQMILTAGFTNVPQVGPEAKSYIPANISTESFQNYSTQYLDTTKRKLCIREIVFRNSKSVTQQCSNFKYMPISQIIKESYSYSNDELKNFEKILNFIEKRAAQNIKDSAYNYLYQEVMNHYMLKKLKRTQMTLCLLEIILDKKQEAIGHFKDLNPTSVSQVIEHAYKFQNGTHFKEMLNFINSKPEISNIEHNILIMTASVVNGSQIICNTDIENVLCAAMLIQIGLKIHSTQIESFYFNKLQELWEHIIVFYCGSIKNYQEIPSNYLDIPSNLHEMDGKLNKIENYFLNIIIPSVRRVLNKKGSNFDMIIECVPRSFPFIETGVMLYSTVFEEMAKQNSLNTNNLITKFAFYLKNYMELPNYSNIEEKYKEVFENLKRNIPDWIQKLIFLGDKCKLKNHKWGQYLSACGEFGCNKSSVDSHTVFATQETTDTQNQWKFVSNKPGSTSYFIKNLGSKEYLYPGSRFVDDITRPVFTRHTKRFWNLWNITASSNGSYINIQSAHNKDYLYVGDPYEKDPQKRSVFIRLGLPTQEMLRESEWELICG
ncbi:uncharacterized protein LOC123298260 [Chrysoperla carnea]|uniref:uncharacterized protein LOC123298260 n=1 Tax=Chrysoperla carnea TaxID=189513 RepID=UPI001D06143E|nr:uncharacterized protein LOC123298260 [Chrysoperla carnea]XP_044736153.1 uncharacterized protein LOC123298260 [Chrysoperla carnea]